MKLHSPNNL